MNFENRRNNYLHVEDIVVINFEIRQSRGNYRGAKVIIEALAATLPRRNNNDIRDSPIR